MGWEGVGGPNACQPVLVFNIMVLQSEREKVSEISGIRTGKLEVMRGSAAGVRPVAQMPPSQVVYGSFVPTRPQRFFALEYKAK
jgi:hypothetical protein